MIAETKMTQVPFLDGGRSTALGNMYIIRHIFAFTMPNLGRVSVSILKMLQTGLHGRYGSCVHF